jgi:hypothetical protein
MREAKMLTLRTLGICAGIAVLGGSGCFGGIISDSSGAGLNGVTVSVYDCPACAANTTTTAPEGTIDGVYKFDPYDGGPVILPSGGAEAVRIRASRALYSTRVIYHRVQYEENPNDSSRYYDLRSFTLHGAASADSDGDGLKDVEETSIGTDPLKADTDGDGLSDGWEVDGHNYVDLAALGADPLHKDVFVECDYMAGKNPSAATIDRVVSAFANAPVSNPDGDDGINLHVEIDDLIPTDIDLNPVWAEFDAIKASNFSSFRDRIFHYCIFGQRFDGTGYSGVSRGIGAEDFVVTLGAGGGTDDQKAGTFMHELGHNLGLRHGGLDNKNNKPNYLSVMNYSFQFSGLMIDGATGVMDYSHFTLASLNENALSEAAGLNLAGGGAEAELAHYGTRYCPNGGALVWDNTAASNVDWNGSGAINAGTVAADINCDGVKDTLLTQHDWGSIVYNGGGLIGLGLGAKAAARVVRPGDTDNCLPFE